MVIKKYFSNFAKGREECVKTPFFQQSGMCQLVVSKKGERGDGCKSDKFMSFVIGCEKESEQSLKMVKGILSWERVVDAENLF